MKFLRITSVYPGYAQNFYSERPGLSNKTYEEQCKAFYYDAFAWADSWKIALQPFGYEVREVVANVAPMQHAWARENISPRPQGDLHSIAVEQIRRFAPDVLWFDDHDAQLLERIREQVPAIRLVMGWTGSAMPRHNAFAQCDIVLSCSKESVERLAALGHLAAELSHAFDPRIVSRLKPAAHANDAIFIGQLIRSRDFHIAREKLLEQAVERLSLRIFSPSPRPSSRTKRFVKRGLSTAYQLMRGVGAGKLATDLLRAVGRNEEWLQARGVPVNPKLVPYMADGIYGLRMYQAIRDAKVTLNIHADSSDRYASNMRLFEVTGVGGCLLTDWKPNLGEMFSADSEISTYRSAAECIEKAQWLVDHPHERAAIAQAGQARTLRDHTFAQRAGQLDAIVKKALRKIAVQA